MGYTTRMDRLVSYPAMLGHRARCPRFGLEIMIPRQLTYTHDI